MCVNCVSVSEFSYIKFSNNARELLFILDSITTQSYRKLKYRLVGLCNLTEHWRFACQKEDTVKKL